MKTYTEEEVKKIVNYCCGMQKADDYQTAGHHLIKPFSSVQEADEAIISVLNILSDSDNNESKNITIEELNEHLEETKDEV